MLQKKSIRNLFKDFFFLSLRTPLNTTAFSHLSTCIGKAFSVEVLGRNLAMAWLLGYLCFPNYNFSEHICIPNG